MNLINHSGEWFPPCTDGLSTSILKAARSIKQNLFFYFSFQKEIEIYCQRHRFTRSNDLDAHGSYQGSSLNKEFHNIAK